MHTVEPRRDSSASAFEVSPSGGGAGSSGVFPGVQQAPVAPFGIGEITHNPALDSLNQDRSRGVRIENLAPVADSIPLWKRVFDVSCVLLSLPLWGPVVILIALWIKIVSPGPVFFRQERVGYRGQRFWMLKFRTMRTDTDTAVHERYLERIMQADSPMMKLDAGDDRIIGGGRILRAAGLDELPQLVNVFRGEMSIVGPRPCTVNEFNRYQLWQQERLNAAPGLTGYWQVNGKNNTTFTEMINLDLFYVKNSSLRLDCAIIIRTPLAILTQLIEAGSNRGANAKEAEDVVPRKKRINKKVWWPRDDR
jgi:lipopolysaccharide/colanic/teichoic acid biosynthesis glycosyltransferase